MGENIGVAEPGGMVESESASSLAELAEEDPPKSDRAAGMVEPGM